MRIDGWKEYRSHGDGDFSREEFAELGENVVFEKGVLVFHPEQISIASNVYIGHNTIIKGYYKNNLKIGTNTWIGQGCFIHSGGGVTIGEAVGIGPGVKIISSSHMDSGDLTVPVMQNQLNFSPVIIEDGCDIGVNSTILPGVTIGKGSVIGAGSVINRDVPEFSVVAGVPGRIIRMRGKQQ